MGRKASVDGKLCRLRRYAAHDDASLAQLATSQTTVNAGHGFRMRERQDTEPL